MARPALDPVVCERARKSKDHRFDGLFFTAVRSTGIYCRPICPAPSPKAQNIKYFATASECEQEGYRPCLRCRPELSPPPPGGSADPLAQLAYQKINSGYLNDHTLSELAQALDCSSRQLSRRFVSSFGVTPNKLHATQRLLFAKQLLSESAMPITQVAFAAGFSSLRRFNDAFRRAYELSPSQLRHRLDQDHDLDPSSAASVAIRLDYRPPFAFEQTLEWLNLRLLAGIEAIEEQSYLRRLPGLSKEQPAWLRLRPHPKQRYALSLELHGVPVPHFRPLVARVRRMFDLDANPQAIADTLASDPQLADLVSAQPGIRIPGAFDGFETLFRAVVGQQISVSAAHTVAQRILKHLGQSDAPPPHPQLGLAPLTPDRFQGAKLDGLGLNQRRIDSIRHAASATIRGDLRFEAVADYDAWQSKLCELPGIGPWTASYVALRALGHPDIFPGGDLVLRKALTPPGEKLISAAQARQRALPWRPFRSYAAFYLWNSQSNPSPS